MQHEENHRPSSLTPVSSETILALGESPRDRKVCESRDSMTDWQTAWRKHFSCCNGQRVNTCVCTHTYIHAPSTHALSSIPKPLCLQSAGTWTPAPSGPGPGPGPAPLRPPALHALLQRAVVVAAGVVVQVHDARVALLSFVHAGVPAHFVAALLETLLGLAFNGLVDGLFTAV